MVGEHLSVIATPQDDEAQPVQGQLTFMDNSVDASSDTIKLKATFTNADRRLWPGQFARVTLRLATLKDAMVVPTQAVQTGQDGQFVFVVKPDSTVEQRPVTTSTTAGDFTVITKGLQDQETVVTEGQLRLESGTKVQAADANGVAPAAPGGPNGGRGRGRGRGQQGS
jgi:multidrug efflux system membrane fusion protein